MPEAKPGAEATADAGDAAPTDDVLPVGARPAAGKRKAETTDWEDSDKARREALRSRVTAVESPEAVAFAQALTAFLIEELAVQESERSSLGAEDLETLAGYRRTRRLRIDRDSAEFLDRAGRFARRALAVPRPSPGVKLPKASLAFLLALGKAYEESRDERRLKVIHDLNDDFLRTANWQARDRAVRLRDELVEQETSYTSLIEQSWNLFDDDVSPGTLEELQARLVVLAPDTDLASGDVASLILTNEYLRQQVIAEVTDVLTSPRTPAAPSRSEAKQILQEATELEIEILTTTGVGALLEEQSKLSAESEEIALRLADRGVNKLDPVARREEVNRQVEITRRLSQIDVEWHTTPIDRTLSSRLIDLQDKLLRFGMFDLGVQGAMLGHAYDDVRDLYTYDEMVGDAAKTWDYLEQQRTLLNIMSTIPRPDDPLAGLTSPEDPGLTEAQYLYQLKQAASSLKKAVAKPPKKGKKG